MTSTGGSYMLPKGMGKGGSFMLPAGMGKKKKKQTSRTNMETSNPLMVMKLPKRKKVVKYT